MEKERKLREAQLLALSQADENKKMLEQVLKEQSAMSEMVHRLMDEFAENTEMLDKLKTQAQESERRQSMIATAPVPVVVLPAPAAPSFHNHAGAKVSVCACVCAYVCVCAVC